MRFSIHDGPGIRTTVFFKGCPLECAWCHNPESIHSYPELLLRTDICLKCGVCVIACEQGAIHKEPEGYFTDRSACVVCGECVKVCPVEARAKIGSTMTVAEVMRTVLADRVFFDQSGGGVTFSGGEPTRQPAFLHSLLQASKREGLHTAVDTCGYAPWEVFEKIAPLTDLFLFDIKLIDPQKHRCWTGVSNRRILENLTKLDAAGWPVSLRIPVIPGLNDNSEDLEQLATWLDTLQNVRQLHLLPFHQGGTEKYHRLGRSFILQETSPADKASIERVAQRLRHHIEIISIGG
jgi:pyruvate formate lyase activating enzyme